MSGQLILCCWVGRSPGCWDVKRVGRQENLTGGDQHEAWVYLGSFKHSHGFLKK